MTDFKDGDLVEIISEFKNGTNSIPWNPVMSGQVGFKARVHGPLHYGPQVYVRFLDSYVPPVGVEKGLIWTYPPECLKKLEVRKPKHPAFKVGDKVKIVRKIDIGLWVTDMDCEVGETGKVLEVWTSSHPNCCKRGARVGIGGNQWGWNYPINSLEKIK